MQKNPLIVPILARLKSVDEPVSEYELLKYLEGQEGLFEHLPDNQSLALFQRHFLVMNALYSLQQILWEQGVYLSVSALSIVCQPVNVKEEGALIRDEGEARLRDYYTDWANFESTSEQDIDALLNSFWHRYLAQEQQSDALSVLGLAAGASWEEIKRAYRHLASEHHPDRGGETATFIAVRQAYEILSRSTLNPF